jgi:hypothetical protein
MRSTMFALACLAFAISGAAKPVMASPHSNGACDQRLQRLGYSHVEFEGSQVHSSLYEAHRGYQEVKVMVDNNSCAVQRVWMDD